MSKKLLEQIAATVTPRLGGIDWPALELRFGMPRDRIVYHVAPTGGASSQTDGLFAYLEVMTAAKARADVALKDVVLSWKVQDDPQTRQSEIKQAMDAFTDVQEDLGNIEKAVLSAVNNNFTFLTPDASLVMQREHFRAIVSSIYMASLYGMVVHANAIMQANNVDGFLIADSADEIVRAYNALVFLSESGALDTLKLNTLVPPPPEAPSTPGVGLTPIAWAAIITISVTLVVAIVAWCVVNMEKQAFVNRMVKDLCEDALKTGDPNKYKRCTELVEINGTATSSPPNPGDWVLEFGKGALLIGIAFAIAWATPTAVRILSDRHEDRRMA